MAQEINQQLFLALQSIVTSMSPEATEFVIGRQSREKVVHNGSNGIVSSEPVVQRLWLSHQWFFRVECNSGRSRSIDCPERLWLRR